MDRTTYDIAIIGSGIACSLLLCELAEQFQKQPRGRKAMRIAIIEREGQLWSGTPYGRRSTVGTLTFQKLDEFLNEPERSSFVTWMTAHQNEWVEYLRECGGPGAARWISGNRPLMDQGRWGELYLPRFVFGRYVSSRTARALQQLSDANLAIVTPIHGEAVEVCRSGSGVHEILIGKGEATRTAVRAERVVLAIGSPPQRSVSDGLGETQEGHTHIRDVYSPSEDITMQRLQHRLASLHEREKANILVLGSNASALEMLYLINYRPEIKKLINSIVVLSRSGSLPYKIEDKTIAFELIALNALAPLECSAAGLMEALRSDIARARQQGLNIADLRDPVGVAVSRISAQMHPAEQKVFVCEYGAAYSRMMRRAGRDTRDAADELVRSGLLTIVEGDFRRLTPVPFSEGLVTAQYFCPSCEAEISHPVPFGITLNCGGFEELDMCSSPLINSLLVNGLCTANSTKRGFLLNERLEASENVYVIGPLVGGNFNAKIRLWHVESASRIWSLAKLLAESLCESLLAGRGVLATAEFHSPNPDVCSPQPLSSIDVPNERLCTVPSA